MAETFKGKHWSKLTLGEMFLHRDALAFLTPPAFRFYLPAFLLAILDHYDEVDMLPLIVIQKLCPPNAPIFEKYNNSLNNLGANTREERQALFEMRLQKSDYTRQEVESIMQFLTAYPLFVSEEQQSGELGMVAPAHEFWSNIIPPTL